MSTATVTKACTTSRRTEGGETNFKPHIAKGRRLGTNKEKYQYPEAAPLAALPATRRTLIAKNRSHISKDQKPSNARSSTAHRDSDPSSSGGSGSRSDDKHSSSDMSGGSHSDESRARGRRSESPSPVASNVVINTMFQDQAPLKSRSHWTHRRKFPKKLNLALVPKAQLDAVAYREGSKSPESREPQSKTHLSIDPFIPTYLSQEALMPTQAPKRPSPKSLREARIKRFSQLGESKAERLNLRGPRPALPSASHLPTMSMAGRNPRVAPGAIIYSGKRRRNRANVNVRLADISIPDMIGYARDGYVVDIVSSFIVRQLPMSKSSKALLKRYTRWGQALLSTGIVRPQRIDVAESGNTWQQWAYISRLNMADIGKDGRRRTLTHVNKFAEEESWTVLLVPLAGGQANELREELVVCQAGNIETTRRRQSLGSEIAGSIEYKSLT